MTVRGHHYRDGIKGRFLTTLRDGRPALIAHVRCTRCPAIGDVNLRVLMAPDQIDKKFTQTGWRLDPHICPSCAAPKPKEMLMAATPSPAAIRGQTETLKLLAQHFDTENGRYVTGWSDVAIAEAAGISTETVAAFRKAGFGDIKEPAEVQLIRADINSLEQLQRDHNSAVGVEIAALRARLGKLSDSMGVAA